MELLIAFACVVLYVFSAQWRKFVNWTALVAFVVAVLVVVFIDTRGPYVGGTAQNSYHGMTADEFLDSK